jgi:oligopeptide/dipeptide ABC transporter ATP-binding protein
VTLLKVQDLHTHFVSRDLDNRVRVAKALNGVSLSVEGGRILGLVGETGAGKSLTAVSIMGLLRPPARIVGGRVLLEGRDLLALEESELNRIRGDRLAMVVQSPKSSLDPLMRVGEQLVRVHLAHRKVGRAAAERRALEMLEAVGIPDAANRARAWPHELSGGMAQRVVIAMALMNEPRLLIADEPTTGLDLTVQAQILDLLRGLVRKTGIGAMIITHDLGVVAHFCDDMVVMFAGAVVERGPVLEVFQDPRHPYTRALIASAPDRVVLGATLRAGGPPDLYDLPAGCLYRDRCAQAAAICVIRPPATAVSPGHDASCHFVNQGDIRARRQ